MTKLKGDIKVGDTVWIDGYPAFRATVMHIDLDGWGADVRYHHPSLYSATWVFRTWDRIETEPRVDTAAKIKENGNMDTKDIKTNDRVEVTLTGTVLAYTRAKLLIKLDDMPDGVASASRGSGAEVYVAHSEVTKKLATELKLEPGDEIKDKWGGRFLLTKYEDFIRVTGPSAGLRYTAAEMAPITDAVYTIVTPND